MRPACLAILVLVFAAGPGLAATENSGFSPRLASNGPSKLFDHVRFGRITRQRDGTIVARFAIGVDIGGTVRDAKGILGVEKHPVTRRAGRWHRLSRAERASLKRALERYFVAHPRHDRLYDRLFEDASK